MKFNLLWALSRWNFEKILKIERVPLTQRYAVESPELSENAHSVNFMILSYLKVVDLNIDVKTLSIDLVS